MAGFDYSSQQYYFVTICTQKRRRLLSDIVGNGLDRSVVSVNTNCGNIAERQLVQIPAHFEGIRIDKYVIMPNHIHMILVIGCDGKTERSRPFPTLSTVIGLYKSGVSREAGFPVWQKSFHDHIIRNAQDYREIWRYIDENPLKWQEDCFYSP
ncbi:MAG: transposase [Butyricicoccaceae bacterium]